ncbi:MAG: phosphoribosylformylglycinamidine synthase subunit PurL, partial [Candidatus Dadabacteria bacterium]
MTDLVDVWSEHGLTREEYERIRAELGRDPNRVELGICGALWSEHCSYKSSRRWLSELPVEGEHVVEGPGENAGIVRLDGDLCIAFKVESHNHPSYIEPYHGAATGVGGILRDVFTMGARPIANLNSLRFGRPDHPKTPFLLNGVVRGIADYGNCVGVPTVAGECSFSPCYDDNILVNAMTVGVVREQDIFRGYASGVGNPVFYVGSATGGDGIHGATMASAAFEEGQEDQRPAVQVGDPFTEKLLIEACLELMASGVVIGIQDMGAAGLTSSSFEMASRAGSGMDLMLDRVPVRQQGLGPYELMLSESQERMLVVLERGREDVAHAIFEKWDLEVAEIGTVTDSGHVRCFWHDDLVADLPVPLLVDDAPRYDRPHRPDPARLELQQRDAALPTDFDAEAALKTLLSHPSLASKAWITRQYDSTVQAGTVRAEGADAAVVRLPGSSHAVAMTIEGNSRLCYLHPHHGAQHVVAEAVRNLACVGAVPLGATDCLNFGNPERPETFWEFVEAVQGLAAGLTRVNVPITGGNVSLYNETSGTGVWPTPVLGVVGRVESALEHVPDSTWSDGGLELLLLGEPGTTVAGSALQQYVLEQVQGELPPPDWALLERLQAVLGALIGDNAILAAHDVAEGGLAVALAEMALAAGIGCVIDVDMPLERWFAEDGQAIVVAVDPAVAPTVVNACRTAGLACAELGASGGDRIVLRGVADVSLEPLRQAWMSALPAVVGEEPADV